VTQTPEELEAEIAEVFGDTADARVLNSGNGGGSNGGAWKIDAEQCARWNDADATLAELAAQADVSESTVRYHLNDCPRECRHKP
jgi:hypothetical protein